MTSTPVLAVAGIIYYYWVYDFIFWDVGNLLIMLVLTGTGLTAGYHRHFSHQTHECHWLIQLFYLVFGAACFENSAYDWSSDHRYHHRFVDTDKDPYNINRGFVWAHIGWIFFENPQGRSFENAKDLAANKLVMWQYRNYFLISALAGFGLPTFIGYLYGNPLGGFLWGGLIRTILGQHFTFLINSWAHYFGTQPYSTGTTAKDSWFLPYFSFGEGYHNFHHTFAGDYRNGHLWYQWDPSKWFIFLMSKIGMTWNLKRVPEDVILYSRVERSYQTMRDLMNAGRLKHADRMAAHLEVQRKRVREAMDNFTLKKREYAAWKKKTSRRYSKNYKLMKFQMRQELKLCRLGMKDSLRQYRFVLRQLRRAAAYA